MRKNQQGGGKTVQQAEITFVVSYRCPNCQAALEARSSEVQQGWLRCPKCGRASLPPSTVRPSPAERALATPDEDLLVIGSTAEDPGMASDAADAATHRVYPAGAVRRVVMALLILFSVSGLLGAFLRRSPLSVAFFGLTSLILFAMVGSTTRRR